MFRTLHPTTRRALCTAALLLPLASRAAIVGSTADVDFTGGATTFGYLGQSFKLADNGSGFPSPVNASTSGTAMLATDFAGISVFFDPPRNDELVDSSFTYASYARPTLVSYSYFPTFIGLEVTAADGVHFGYAEFAGTFLEGYAFQTTPGVGVAFGAALVPEPATIALLGVGLAAMTSLRRRRD